MRIMEICDLLVIGWSSAADEDDQRDDGQAPVAEDAAWKTPSSQTRPLISHGTCRSRTGRR